MNRNKRQLIRGEKPMANGREVLVPGRVSVTVQHMPSPLATPASVTMSGNGQVQLMVFGGQTQLQVVATQLLAAMIPVCNADIGGDTKRYINLSVAMAKELIAACAAGEPNPASV